MMKTLLIALVASVVLQACGNSGSGGGGAAVPPPVPFSPGSPSPGAPAQNPSAPVPPPVAAPESGGFLSAVDQQIAATVVGDRFVTERFVILMSRLSVYALICDFKNQYGYSTQFSKLYNSSTELQKLSEKVYGVKTGAYNRFEKQRNIESRRLSFESGPTACAVSEASFKDYIGLTAAQVTTIIKTTPRGAL